MLKKIQEKLFNHDATATIPQLIELAASAAVEAGKAILEIYRSGEYGVTMKKDYSPLTLADRAAHQIILSHLEVTNLPVLSEEGKHTPFEERRTWPVYWLVDPLDGTKEFLKRNGEFTVNIALMRQNIPIGGVVYAPILDTLYLGSKTAGAYKEVNGIRDKLSPSPTKAGLADLLKKKEVRAVASRSHLNPETENLLKQFTKTETLSMGSSLKFMLLAENKADIYPRFAPTMEWDTAAAHAILIALNKRIHQLDLQTELQYNKPELLNPSFIAL